MGSCLQLPELSSPISITFGALILLGREARWESFWNGMTTLGIVEGKGRSVERTST